MKHITKLASLMLVVCTLLFAACGNKEGESSKPTGETKGVLEGTTWVNEDISVTCTEIQTLRFTTATEGTLEVYAVSHYEEGDEVWEDSDNFTYTLDGSNGEIFFIEDNEKARFVYDATAETVTIWFDTYEHLVYHKR